MEPLLAVSCDSDEDVRNTAVEVLTWIGRSIVEPLASILRGSDEDLPEAAIGALVRLGLEQLVAALHNSDKEVRLASVEAIGGLGDIRAVEPVAAMLYDNAEVRRRLLRRWLGLEMCGRWNQCWRC